MEKNCRPSTIGAFLKGVSIVKAELDDNNYLIIYLSNGETYNAGQVPACDDILDYASERPVKNKTLYAAIKSLQAETRELRGNKVDKVDGKGLSTEDFTTTFKVKLEGLENYDDTAVRSMINAIEARLNSLVGQSASDAIDTFNEIVGFLKNIEDSTTLESVLVSIENQIAVVNNKFENLHSEFKELDNNKVDKVTGERLITEEEVAAISKNTADIKTMDGKYLAATPSGNPNHNLYISLGATWSDAGWELNGVPLTKEEIDVSYLCSVSYLHRVQDGAWSNMQNYLSNRFKTNFPSLLGTAYNTPQKALNANGIGITALKLQVVRFQNLRSETLYRVYITNSTYMFNNSPQLREIQDYLDVSLCTLFNFAFGARATSLETIWLIGLKANIDFSGTPVLKKECLLYMIQKAAPTTAITIKVHADIYAWASTDPEVQAAITAQQSLIILIA